MWEHDYYVQIWRIILLKYFDSFKNLLLNILLFLPTQWSMDKILMN